MCLELSKAINATQFTKNKWQLSERENQKLIQILAVLRKLNKSEANIQNVNELNHVRFKCIARAKEALIEGDYAFTDQMIYILKRIPIVEGE